MPRVTPQTDDWLIQAMVVAKNAHGSRREIQAAGSQSRFCNPARGENAQYVPMAEDEHVAFEPTNPSNDTVRAPDNIRQRFPAGAAVLEQNPARELGPSV